MLVTIEIQHFICAQQLDVINEWQNRNVLHAYIDESYESEGHYYVGALVVEPSVGANIRQDFDQICQRVSENHGSPQHAELHGYSLFHMEDDWICLKEKARVAVGAYNAALKSITNSGGKLFFRGIDTVKQRQTYLDPWPPHLVALQYVLEEVHKYAVSQNKRVKVIADQVQDQHHHERRIEIFQRVGTMGYKSSKLDSIDLPFEWSDSRNHRNLQAIDMATFLYRRKFAHIETNELTREAVNRLYKTMQPAVITGWLWVPTPKPEYPIAT
jgi:hypothetical protein